MAKKKGIDGLADSVMKPKTSKKAERLIQNRVKMQNLGPDDPIPFDALGTSPDREKKASLLKRFFSPIVKGAAAETGEKKKKPSKDSLIVSLLGKGLESRKPFKSKR